MGVHRAILKVLSRRRRVTQRNVQDNKKEKRGKRKRGAETPGRASHERQLGILSVKQIAHFLLNLILIQNHVKHVQLSCYLLQHKTLHVKQNCPACIKAETPEGRRRFVTSDLAQTRAKRAQREKIGSLHTLSAAMAASEGAKHVWSVKQKSAELPLRWLA